MTKHLKYLALVLAMTLAVGTVLGLTLSTTAGAAAKKEYIFYYVDHGTPGNPFWAVYYKGIEDATKWLAPCGVKVKHLSAEADVKKQIEQ